MRALLLFAEDDVGAIEGWFRLVDGRVVARGARLDTISPIDEEERIFLLLAGSEVALRWLDIPALTEPQALAAARIALADHSLGSVDALHVAIGPLHGGHRLVATIAVERIAAWIDWARGAGFDPDHIMPLPLAIAYGEGPAKLWQRPGRTLVHGHMAAFAVEAELAEAILGDAPRETIDDARFEAELPAALATLPIDLRQGAWRRRRQWHVEPGWGRRMRRYAIAAAILLALIPFARLGRIAYDGWRLRQEAAKVAQQALGLPDIPDDPRAALQARLRGLQGPGMGFIEGSAVLFGAVRQTPNVELTRLDFDESGALSADVMAVGAADLGELARRVGSSGLIVETSGGGTGRLTVRQP